MYRKVFGHILLFAVLLQVGSRGLIYLEYELNKEYIASVLCVNKERIPMCSGQCYLNDKLNQNQEQQQEQTPTQLKFAWEVMIVPVVDIAVHQEPMQHSQILETAALQPTEAHWKYCLREKGIFHPPC